MAEDKKPPDTLVTVHDEDTGREWCVMDGTVMKCLNCGATHDIKELVPIHLEDLTELMNIFRDEHEECKETTTNEDTDKGREEARP